MASLPTLHYFWPKVQISCIFNSKNLNTKTFKILWVYRKLFHSFENITSASQNVSNTRTSIYQTIRRIGILKGAQVSGMLHSISLHHDSIYIRPGTTSSLGKYGRCAQINKQVLVFTCRGKKKCRDRYEYFTVDRRFDLDLEIVKRSCVIWKIADALSMVFLFYFIGELLGKGAGWGVKGFRMWRYVLYF